MHKKIVERFVTLVVARVEEFQVSIGRPAPDIYFSPFPSSRVT
jgi:hypothetical protein